MVALRSSKPFPGVPRQDENTVFSGRKRIPDTWSLEIASEYNGDENGKMDECDNDVRAEGCARADGNFFRGACRIDP